MVAAMADSDTALVVVVGLGLLGLFGLGVICIAYFVSQAAVPREPTETVVYVRRMDNGSYEIVEKAQPAERGVRFVTI